MNTAGALIDGGLLERAGRGDAGSVAELFEAHWHGAWRVAVGITGDPAAAEDVAQEAFLQAVRELRRFDGRRPFAVWLHRIVVNRAIDHLRRERRRAGLADRVAAVAVPVAEDAAPPGLLDALLGLSEDQRAVVFLHFWVGHTIDDIATVLGVPRGTVRSRLARAMTALRAHPELQSPRRTDA